MIIGIEKHGCRSCSESEEEKYQPGIPFSSQQLTAIMSIGAAPLEARSRIMVILSEALRAAAVSVVKSEIPVPAPIPPKITTLPFSRWRIARCLLYGSATSGIENALCKRVCTPNFSSADWSSMEFINVAIIL
nr:Uncharacterised protein [Ipomoea trifida]